MDKIVDMLDQSEAENEVLKQVNEAYQKEFGSKNTELIESYGISVIRTPERSFAMRRAKKYVKEYEENYKPK